MTTFCFGQIFFFFYVCQLENIIKHRKKCFDCDKKKLYAKRQQQILFVLRVHFLFNAHNIAEAKSPWNKTLLFIERCRAAIIDVYVYIRFLVDINVWSNYFPRSSCIQLSNQYSSIEFHTTNQNFMLWVNIFFPGLFDLSEQAFLISNL